MYAAAGGIRFDVNMYGEERTGNQKEVARKRKEDTPVYSYTRETEESGLVFSGEEPATSASCPALIGPGQQMVISSIYPLFCVFIYSFF